LFSNLPDYDALYQNSNKSLFLNNLPLLKYLAHALPKGSQANAAFSASAKILSFKEGNLK
jgi:hypothetical protein